tara:strand:- start:2377 stop:2622 length:246 start_codon:yes stop_codon:yes gene_type:complete
MSSAVSILQIMGVGIAQIDFPHGHKYITMLVHGDTCVTNISASNITGMKFTSNVALSGLTASKGIRGKGGHQHVKFLITIE